MGWMAGVHFPSGAVIFFFTTTSRLAQGPTYPYSGYWKLYFQVLNDQNIRLAIHLILRLGSRIMGFYGVSRRDYR
jgi:hypothetical protein